MLDEELLESIWLFYYSFILSLSLSGKGMTVCEFITLSLKGNSLFKNTSSSSYLFFFFKETFLTTLPARLVWLYDELDF